MKSLYIQRPASAYRAGVKLRRTIHNAAGERSEPAPSEAGAAVAGKRWGDQSVRSVTMGSTRAARRDGIQLATSATAASNAATPKNVTGSLALTS